MPGLQPARVRAQPHGSAQGVEVLSREDVDHRVGRSCESNSDEFAPSRPATFRGELDHRALQTETDPEERDVVLPRVPNGFDLALDAAHAEPAGNEDAVEVVRAARRGCRSSRSSDAIHVISTSGRDGVAGVLEALDHRRDTRPGASRTCR